MNCVIDSSSITGFSSQEVTDSQLNGVVIQSPEGAWSMNGGSFQMGAMEVGALGMGDGHVMSNASIQAESVSVQLAQLADVSIASDMVFVEGPLDWSGVTISSGGQVGGLLNGSDFNTVMQSLTVETVETASFGDMYVSDWTTPVVVSGTNVCSPSWSFQNIQCTPMDGTIVLSPM